MTNPQNPHAPPNATPPPVQQQAPQGAQLPPELQAELARMQAAQAARQRPTSVEKRDDEWYSTAKPDVTGRTTECYVLMLPSTMANPAAMPYRMTAQHHITVRGQPSSVVCPRRDAQIRDPSGANGPPPPCPICDASEFCFAQMKQFARESAEGDLWKQRGKDLAPRDRCFANIFDLDNVQSHWRMNAETGTAGSVPKCWGFGPEIEKKLREMIGAIGMFWHPSSFTRIKIITARTGPETRNIKYDVSITMPIGGAQIPPGYEGALQSLIDLDYYCRVRPVAELVAFVPGYARSGGEQESTMAPPPAVPNPYRPPNGAPPNPYGAPQYAPAPAPAPVQRYAPPPFAAAPTYNSAPQYAQPPPIQHVPAPQYAQPPPAAPPVYAPPPMPAQHQPLPSTPPQYAAPPTQPGYSPPPPAGPSYAPPTPPQMQPLTASSLPWEEQPPPQQTMQPQYVAPSGMPPLPGLPPIPTQAPPAPPPAQTAPPPPPGMPALPSLPPPLR